MPLTLRTQSMIKDAFDNLPGGICCFDDRGVPVFINRTMNKLVFALTKRDLQSLSDLDEIMSSPAEVFPGDGSVWRFSRRIIRQSDPLTEIIATDITELYRRKRELEQRNAEQREVMLRLEKISENIVSITRNEEILSMKMRVHNELGYAISAARRFITTELSEDEKREYIESQRRMAKKLLEETENDDEPSVFSELKNSAEKLGMEIVFEGALPADYEDIMTKAVRECLVNAVRHAAGDKVFVKTNSENGFEAIITNNGKAPSGEISEGGGLSALRRSVSEMNGKMEIKTLPEFSLKLSWQEIPERGEAK